VTRVAVTGITQSGVPFVIGVPIRHVWNLARPRGIAHTLPVSVAGPAGHLPSGEPGETTPSGEAATASDAATGGESAIALGTVVPPVVAPRRRRLLMFAVPAGLVVVLVVAAALVVPAMLRGNGTTVRSRPASAAVPSPTATEVSADQYQQALDALDHDLGPEVATLGSVTNAVTVGAAAKAIQATLLVQVPKLKAILPPAPTRPAHEHLLGALRDFGADVDDTVAKAGGNRLCGGVSALAALTGGNGASALRQAAGELATADPARAYHAGSFLPGATPEPDRRLANGATIKKPGSRAVNRLKIDNQATHDAVLSGAPPGSPSATFMVYVRAGESYTFVGVPDGSYRVYVTVGVDWDSAGKTFTRDCTYDHIVKPELMDFTSSRTQYSQWAVTVNAIPVTAGRPDEGAFPT